MAVSLADRFAGSMLGSALGDALGAPHEGGAVGGLVWKLVSRPAAGELRWTDDTEMAIGLAASLIERRGLDTGHLAARWARDYDWRRGYGPGARKLLGLLAEGEDWRTANRLVFPDGSLGNGAAMRAGPLGLFYHADPAALRRAAARASEITHAHPLGIDGGILIACATAFALDLEPPIAAGPFLHALRRVCATEEFQRRLRRAERLLDGEAARQEVADELGCGVRAHESAVTAVYCFLRYVESDFARLMEFIARLGGDTDTIGAMAGALFGACRGAGALPEEMLVRLEDRERIEKLAARLLEAAQADPAT